MASSSPQLSASGRIYVSAVVVIGLTVIVRSVYDLADSPIGNEWFLLAALTLVSGSATVKLPSVPASISISEPFVVTAVLLYGPSAGTLTVALDGLVISFWIAKRRRELYRALYRALFNMSAPAASLWAAAHLFFWTAGIQPLVLEGAPLDKILPSLLLFAVTYFASNSWLITFAIALEKGVSPFGVWRSNFVWLSLNYFCGASVALLLVVYTRQIDIRSIGVILPLLLVLYFTFKTSMDRVEDANRHVEKVNRLYLSTIEALAMAVDAKDQITHGHIRRVQQYAVGLAKRLGVADGALLRAIEAAALLHDMGKLAVPEHILNKPGRLTEAEFEKMKTHASIGAEMLSAIEFPYPVVPIVRHHHENWDGTGYPDGIRGTDIPIGARILSVVDCFDALTSDRPYRRRLTDEQALEILNERKGTMYDPLVVETFARVFKDLDVSVPAPDIESSRAEGTLPPERNAKPRATHRDKHAQIVALECQAALLTTMAAAVPAEVSVFYEYEPDSDSLVAHQVNGLDKVHLEGSTIALGDRLSGWVAAAQQSIANSDAALDLGTKTEDVHPALRYCLAVPVVIDSSLVGVVSLYSSTRFTREQEIHCRMALESLTSPAKEPAPAPALIAVQGRV
jgi:putative nucleotidyltransferase with HDIG domain